jgi:DNA-binding GntR family transcriptional regulator
MSLITNKTTSLSEQAYETIEALIVKLELPPGSAFTENELSQKLGIGRTPIREALQRLAAHRLVVSLPRRGIVVTEINIAEHLVILETRCVLDKLIAARAARRANFDQRHELKNYLSAIKDAARKDDLEEFMRLDHESDLILEAASHNSFAVRACAPLHTHCRRFWYKYHEKGDLKKSAELHADVLTAVSEANEQIAEQAAEDLIMYLDKFTRSVLDIY